MKSATKENQQLPSKEASLPQKNIMQSLALFYVTFLIYIAPIKLGVVVLSDEISTFNLADTGMALDSIFNICLAFIIFLFQFIWPPFMMPFLCAIALILVLCAYPKQTEKLKGIPVFIGWSFILIATLAGSVNSTESSAVLQYIFYFTGILTFICAVIILVSHDERTSHFFFVAICLSTSYLIFKGIDDYFNKTKMMLMYFEEQKAKGILLPQALINRVKENQLNGTFASSNNFAAHLILTIPILLAGIWQFAGKFDPQKISRLILIPLVTILSVAVLFYTYSRGAIIALLLAIPITFFFLPIKKKIKWNIFFFLCLSIIVGVVKISTGGGAYESMLVRKEYFSAALKMFKNFPLFGAGMAEFFHYFMKFKPPGFEETRVPHSFFFGFLSQAGFIGGTAVVTCILLSLKQFFTIKKHKNLTEKIIYSGYLCGWLAWFIHANIDFNIQIVGTVMIFSIIPLLLNTEKKYLQKSSLYALYIPLIIISFFCFFYRMPKEMAYGEFSKKIMTTKYLPLPSLKTFTHKATKNNPGFYAPWKQAGDKCLRQAMSLNEQPQTPELQADYKELINTAENFYAKAIQFSPHRSLLYARHAEASFLKGNISEAEKSFVTSIKWYPYNKKSNLLGIQIYHFMIQKYPKDNQYYNKLVLCYNRLAEAELGDAQTFLRRKAKKLAQKSLNNISAQMNILNLFLSKNKEKIHTDIFKQIDSIHKKSKLFFEKTNE